MLRLQWKLIKYHVTILNWKYTGHLLHMPSFMSIGRILLKIGSWSKWHPPPPTPSCLRVTLFCSCLLGWAKHKNTCVSGYRPSLGLGHRPWFFYCCFWFFYNWFFSEKNVSTFKSQLTLKVTTCIKADCNKRLETICFWSVRARQKQVSRDQTVSKGKWRSNEPWYSSVFIKSTSGK